MSDHFVYALVDSQSSVRYVGLTADPERRFASHLRNHAVASKLGDAARYIVLAAVRGVRAGRVVERYFVRRLAATRDLLNIRLHGESVADFPDHLPSTPREPIRTEAARIVRERFARGDSADAIAADYGVSRRAVYRWTTGRERPSRTLAGRIVAAEKARSA